MKYTLVSTTGLIEEVNASSINELKEKMYKMPYVEEIEYNVNNRLCGYDLDGNVVLVAHEVK